MPTMLAAFVQPVRITVHTAANPTDEEWDTELKGVDSVVDKMTGGLVWTAGGGPTLFQRNRAAEYWKGRIMPRLAIMTPSRTIRGLVTTMNWAVKSSPLKAFAEDDFEGALTYLGAADKKQDVMKKVLELRSALGI